MTEEKKKEKDSDSSSMRLGYTDFDYWCKLDSLPLTKFCPAFNMFKIVD